MLNENSVLEFHALRYINLPEKNNLYKLNLARRDLKSSINVDDKAIKILKLLQAGKSIKQTAKEMNFSILVVMTIVKLFEQNDFVKSVNHQDYSIESFTPDSKIEFFKLKWSTNPDDHNLYGIVRWDTDESLRVDGKVIEIVQMLQAGKTIREAAKTIDYSVNVVMMVMHMLEDAHFFKSIDGIYQENDTKKIKPWFPNMNRKVISWLFSKPLLYFQGIFVISGILLGVQYAGFPTYKNIFWTPDLFTVFVSLFILNFLALVTHELGHFLATKAVGGEAVMRLNYRYLFIVGETESYHLALVSRKARYLVYLAGSLVDISIIGVCYWIYFLAHIGQIDLSGLHNILLVVILIEVLGIIWQFDAFLETDMYNFLTEYLGMENLKSDALKYLDLHVKNVSKILLFPIKQLLLLFSNDYKHTSDDLRMMSKNDKRKLVIYIFVLIAGIAFTTFQFFYYSIPRDITFLYDSVTNLIRATNHNDGILLVKSIIIIIYILYEYLLLLYFKIKGEKSK